MCQKDHNILKSPYIVIIKKWAKIYKIQLGNKYSILAYLVTKVIIRKK